jgi:hypothetical protein
MRAIGIHGQIQQEFGLGMKILNSGVFGMQSI